MCLLFLPRNYRFDVVEFGEGFHWRKVVDVEVENCVANLAQYGVVELEE